MATTGTFGLSRIGQIGVVIDDLERATAFYRDTLGLPYLFDVPGQMAFFDCDGVWLMLSLPEGETTVGTGSLLYFDVDDIGAAHETLASRGVEFDAVPHRIADMGSYELWMAFFRDPDANVLALRSRVAKG